ncbi:uncharacterized protein P884DRAFT_274879 [Thermothelomyces heterothallicus CBS 202.75]|uniref:uncharacterized protein n=1 Tax=Thermothelomyces heterothallicus CBS 202.75 TaxID=1149848 RepID=UPI0037423146
MASNHVLDGYDKVPDEIIRPEIRDLLSEYLASWDKTETEEEKKDKRKEKPILNVAIKLRDNDGFVQQIRESCPAEHLAALLADQDGDGRNALHHIFAWPDDKPRSRTEANAKRVLTLALELVLLATAETLAAKDKDGNTPIHYAADPDIPALDGGTVSSSKSNIKKTLEGRNSRRMSIEKQPIDLKGAKNVMAKSTGTGNNTAAGATKKQPGAYLKIQEFLELHYIRHRPDMEARDLIYGKDASDTNLYFDASGHSRADSIITLIERMSAGSFQKTLSYEPRENANMGRSDLVSVFDKLSKRGVKRILRLQVDDLAPPAHTDAAIELALKGIESLQLPQGRETAIVSSSSHNEAPAEERQKSREPILVENWDWRKPDLSSDVIFFAAPQLEHVNLYWSGNQTVLTKLKTLKLYVAPGLESAARMDKMIEIFKNDLASNSRGRIDVKVARRLKGLVANQNGNEEQRNATGNPAESSPLTIAQRQHVWVTTMDRFRKSLGIEPSKIKLALIDDGADVDQLRTYKGIVTARGRSYYPPSGHAENPWHRSTDGHGTIMANMIAHTNPWVSLQVLKVHSKRLPNGDRTIFAESAAKAIRGAIRRGMDIISISWAVKSKKPREQHDNRDLGATRQPPDPETAAITELEAAIREAVREKILIFCSASDQFGERAKDSLPYRQAPD